MKTVYVALREGEYQEAFGSSDIWQFDNITKIETNDHDILELTSTNGVIQMIPWDIIKMVTVKE